MSKILSFVKAIQGIAVIFLFFSVVFLGGSEFQVTEEAFNRQWNTGLHMIIWSAVVIVICELIARLIYYRYGGEESEY